MPNPDPATIDAGAVAALAQHRVSWADKGSPPEAWGRTAAEVVALRLPLDRFPTPLLTLSAPAMRHNLETLAAWCAERGLDLAPHGKTTMAPRLWADQLEAGAWAITLANLPQLAIGRAFGVSRVLIANELLSPLALRWVSEELARDPAAEVICWADSEQTVEVMDRALAGHAVTLGSAYRPIDVLVEVGSLGGRTGARDVETAVAVGRALARSPYLRLAGVGGYEGAISHDNDSESLTRVRDYLATLREIHHRVDAAQLYPAGREPVVTAGGSMYFDLVADVLQPLTAEGVRVVLRSGAYLAHDDGMYRQVSPLGGAPRTSGPTLRAAMHGWARVTSQPEPGLALFDAGKRDIPYDEGMPEVQLRRGRTVGEPPVPLSGLAVTAVNDQHGFLHFDPSTDPPVRVGDELRLGLSHPCTAFDKWRLIPVIDDPEAAEPVVVDLIRTFF
jgi:D-serine deaminase-like pyridoxal phosphate-dependent protein